MNKQNPPHTIEWTFRHSSYAVLLDLQQSIGAVITKHEDNTPETVRSLHEAIEAELGRRNIVRQVLKAVGDVPDAT